MFSQGIGFQSVYSTPGGGGTQTLQDITTNGNETDKSIILVDEFGAKIRITNAEGQFIVNKLYDDSETTICVIDSNGISFSIFLEQLQLIKETGGSSKYIFPNNTVFELVASREWTALELANKADLVGGKIPASQIPSGFDEIFEYSTFTAFPVVGQSNIYYVALDTNKTFRWSGSGYVIMNEGIALGETSSTAYRGDRGKTAYDHSQTLGNPHGTTAAQVGAYTKTEVDVLLLTKAGISLIPIETTTDGTVTSGVSITVSSVLAIPGGTYGSGITLDIMAVSRKTGANGTLAMRFYANTTPDLSGSPILLGQGSFIASNLQGTLQRLLRIKVADGTGAGTEITSAGTTNILDYSGVGAASQNVAINWNNTVYIIATNACGSGSDSARTSLLKIRR